MPQTRLVRIRWCTHDSDGQRLRESVFLLQPSGRAEHLATIDADDGYGRAGTLWQSTNFTSAPCFGPVAEGNVQRTPKTLESANENRQGTPINVFRLSNSVRRKSPLIPWTTMRNVAADLLP